MNHSHHDHSHRHPAETNLTAAVTSLPVTHEHDHSAHQGHSEHATTHDAHMMKMWFHGGARETILFECWQIETYWGLFFSCIAIILMGVLYEGVKWLRVYLHNVQLAKERQAATCPKLALSDIHSQADEVLLNKVDSQAPDSGTLRSEEVYKSTVTRENNRVQQCCVDKVLRRLDILNPSPCSLFRILQTFLYIFQIMVAYWLMLIAMTYNTYLTVAVVLGCGLGHWIFAIANFVRFSNDTVASGAFAGDVCH